MSTNEENTEIPKTGLIIPLEVRCGHCFHFEKEKAARYADVCSKLGILPVTRPCKAFMPNISLISFKSSQDKSFAEILDNIPTSKLMTFAALVNQEKTTRRQGFKHGQLVYVRIFPADYLSNYVRAWVLLAIRGRVMVQGKSGFRGSFMKESILTQDEYFIKHKALASRKRVVDPKLNTYTKWKPKLENKVLKDYVPPTIDEVDVLKIKKPKEKPKDEYGDVIYVRGKNANKGKAE